MKQGFKQFLFKTGIFLFLFFLIKFIANLILTKITFYKTYLKIPYDFYLYGGTSFTIIIQSILFILVAFILFNRIKLKNLESFKLNKLQSISFLLISFFFLFLHYYLKYFINQNLEFALQHVLIFSILKLLFNILFTIFLALGVFNLDFVIYFLKKFKKSLIVFTFFCFIFYFINSSFQSLWRYFSTVVTKIIYFLLSLFYENIYLNLNGSKIGPTLAVENFNVAVGKPCSGIDSMLLFTSLFILIFILDYKVLKKKLTLLLFIPGLVGIFLFNILRVFLLMMIGIEMSKGFAVGLFHQNIGWMLFIIYFILFYLVVRRWIYE